ncbi:class I adenylate-forming enzyme family protein [Desertibaculum subflavum]|uniref:class I adenylate-forming enzyme family protein n=1 Tax=Desertibaculum subflavum TaxID=2268458 RepID=UPI0013C4F4DE
MTVNYIDLYDRAARIAGDRAALIDDGGSISYAALTALTNRFANALVAGGFGPSTRFALFSPNCSAAMVAMLGGLRAGGAWCNINLRNAIATNIDILARGGCEALFFHSSTAELVEQIRAGVKTLRFVICIDRDLPGFPSLATVAGEGSGAAVNVRLAPGEIGFQGSTGGTTGAPKITQGDPGFLAWNTIGFMTELQFGGTPPVNLAVAPITHAGGIVAMATLAMGGTVVLMPAVDLGKLLEAVERYRVSLLFLPPTVIYMLMNHPKVRQTDFSSLRYLMSAAAPFAVEKIAQAHEIFGPVICQSFGQTESGFPLTFMPPWAVTEALRNPAHAGRLKSVGLPTPNVAAIEIMDDQGRLLPPGEVGEIVMQGPTAMLRYVNDPEATVAIKAGGWQHTGDLGFRDRDGFIYVSDRKRDLIISGGFNVFPLEVEQVLVAHPAVQDCAVIGVPDEKWGEAVTAVVELAPGGRATPAELIQLCRDRLGPVMAPKHVEFIEALPRSAVGKVLKRELRERYWKGKAGRI